MYKTKKKIVRVIKHKKKVRNTFKHKRIHRTKKVKYVRKKHNKTRKTTGGIFGFNVMNAVKKAASVSTNAVKKVVSVSTNAGNAVLNSSIAKTVATTVATTVGNNNFYSCGDFISAYRNFIRFQRFRTGPGIESITESRDVFFKVLNYVSNSGKSNTHSSREYEYNNENMHNRNKITSTDIIDKYCNTNIENLTNFYDAFRKNEFNTDNYDTFLKMIEEDYNANPTSSYVNNDLLDEKGFKEYTNAYIWALNFDKKNVIYGNLKNATKNALAATYITGKTAVQAIDFAVNNADRLANSKNFELGINMVPGTGGATDIKDTTGTYGKKDDYNFIKKHIRSENTNYLSATEIRKIDKTPILGNDNEKIIKKCMKTTYVEYNYVFKKNSEKKDGINNINVKKIYVLDGFITTNSFIKIGNTEYSRDTDLNTIIGILKLNAIEQKEKTELEKKLQENIIKNKKFVNDYYLNSSKIKISFINRVNKAIVYRLYYLLKDSIYKILSKESFKELIQKFDEKQNELEHYKKRYNQKNNSIEDADSKYDIFFKNLEKDVYNVEGLDSVKIPSENYTDEFTEDERKSFKLLDVLEKINVLRTQDKQKYDKAYEEFKTKLKFISEEDRIKRIQINTGTNPDAITSKFESCINLIKKIEEFNEFKNNPGVDSQNKKKLEYLEKLNYNARILEKNEQILEKNSKVIENITEILTTLPFSKDQPDTLFFINFFFIKDIIFNNLKKMIDKYNADTNYQKIYSSTDNTKENSNEKSRSNESIELIELFYNNNIINNKQIKENIKKLLNDKKEMTETLSQDNEEKLNTKLTVSYEIKVEKYVELLNLDSIKELYLSPTKKLKQIYYEKLINKINDAIKIKNYEISTKLLKKIEKPDLYCIDDSYYHVYEDTHFMLSKTKSDKKSNTFAFLEKIDEKINEYKFIGDTNLNINQINLNFF